jgi:hypothetical protein
MSNAGLLVLTPITIRLLQPLAASLEHGDERDKGLGFSR